mgnify:CR=1 FL=1
MFKLLHPTVKIILLLLFGILCIIFPLYILDHEGMQRIIAVMDRNSRGYELYALVAYAVLWYVPLIIGTCLLTFIPIGLLIVFIKNKKKADKQNDYYTGY